MKQLLLFITVTLVAIACYGELSDGDKAIKNNLNSCEASPRAINNYEPQKFNNSNNLQKAAGDFNNVEDRTVNFEGQVARS